MSGKGANRETVLISQLDLWSLLCMNLCQVGQRDILGQAHWGLAKDIETDKGQLSSGTHCQVIAAHGQAAGQNR